MSKSRCEWCVNSASEMKYHDEEWGVPVYDDRVLFEFITLEGAQAGLSWTTILNKRENYRKAFDDFDVHQIINYDDKKIDSLIKNPGIVRNKLKINSVISNARAFIDIQDSHGSFSNYIWAFVGGKPIQNNYSSISQVPAKTDISDAMSNQLKKDGFKFMGSTICYAFMQAVGMVNDHVTSCYRYQEVKEGWK